MNYKISLSKNGTCLKIRVLEAITENLERELAKHAIEEAKQNNVSKFLVDVRNIPNKASPIEQYFLGYQDVNALGLDKDSRIAILVNENDRSHDFIETVFVNAGYACKIFPDEDSATKWLGE